MAKLETERAETVCRHINRLIFNIKLNDLTQMENLQLRTVTYQQSSSMCYRIGYDPG